MSTIEKLKNFEGDMIAENARLRAALADIAKRILRAQNHYSEEWILVGQSSRNALIVRGGDKPVAISINHSNSTDIFDLLADANEAIRARQAAKKSG